MLAGKIIDFKASQLKNTYSSIAVTLVGMVTDVNAVQPANADPPIAVTLGGITILDNSVQSLNALSGIDVTVAGMVTAGRQRKSYTDGAKEGNLEGLKDGEIGLRESDGFIVGCG